MSEQPAAWYCGAVVDVVSVVEDWLTRTTTARIVPKAADGTAPTSSTSAAMERAVVMVGSLTIQLPPPWRAST
jgi:hypothetical protein